MLQCRVQAATTAILTAHAGGLELDAAVESSLADIVLSIQALRKVIFVEDFL